MRKLPVMLAPLLLLGCASAQLREQPDQSAVATGTPSLYREGATAMPGLAVSPERLLIGKWRQVDFMRALGGRPGLVRQKGSGDIVLEFKPDNTWSVTGPLASFRGHYRWLDDGRLEQVVTESSVGLQIGTRSLRNVKIDGSHLELELVSERPATEPAPDGRPAARGEPETVIGISHYTRVGHE